MRILTVLLLYSIGGSTVAQWRGWYFGQPGLPRLDKVAGLWAATRKAATAAPKFTCSSQLLDFRGTGCCEAKQAYWSVKGEAEDVHRCKFSHSLNYQLFAVEPGQGEFVGVVLWKGLLDIDRAECLNERISTSTSTIFIYDFYGKDLVGEAVKFYMPF